MFDCGVTDLNRSCGGERGDRGEGEQKAIDDFLEGRLERNLRLESEWEWGEGMVAYYAPEKEDGAGDEERLEGEDREEAPEMSLKVTSESSIHPAGSSGRCQIE